LWLTFLGHPVGLYRSQNISGGGKVVYINANLCTEFSKLFPIFGESGRNLTKLYQGTWLEAGVIKWTLIVQGVPPTKFGRAKSVQN